MSEASANDSLAAPRLSIIDLMLWTATSALGLTIVNLLRVTLPYGNDPGVQAVSAVISGLLVAGLLRLALEWRRWKRVRMTAPGYWLLVIGGCETLMGWCLIYGLFWWSQSNLLSKYFSLESVRILFAVQAVYHLLQACLELVATAAIFRVKETWSWRTVFVVLPAESLLHATSYFYFVFWGPFGSSGALVNLISYGLNIAVCLGAPVMSLALTVAMIADRRGRISRDWLHYAGCAGVLGHQALVVVRWLIVFLPR